MPIWHPNPSWAHKDPAQPAEDCQPIWLPDQAYEQWAFWAPAIIAAARHYCADCPSEVGSVYTAYFGATGSPRFHWNERTDGATCPINSLKNDPDHIPHERPIIDAVQAHLPSLVSRLRGVPSVQLSLTEAGVPHGVLHAPPSIGCTTGSPNSPACLWLSHNNRFGGLLFGKGHEEGSIVDSEYGNDTRDVDGTVELTKIADAADPTRISVSLRFELNWHLVDAVDFCPGNTVSWSWIQHIPLSNASCLEATGMARDIRIEAEYTRPRVAGPFGPFPSPDPAPAPPTHTLPAETLFAFDSDALTPGAVEAVHRELGPRGTVFNLARDVEVVGHTDSVPGPTPDYNQGLSERRARAVRRLLEREYPSLAGHISESGRGDTQPVADNSTAAGRAANRRVDITLVER